MTEAFIFDALRTPRGKGKQGGALNQATPIYLAATALRALRDRNNLDTSKVDDVVLGCVEPVGEQGADIARVAALYADYATSAPGVQSPSRRWRPPMPSLTSAGSSPPRTRAPQSPSSDTRSGRPMPGAPRCGPA